MSSNHGGQSSKCWCVVCSSSNKVNTKMFVIIYFVTVVPVECWMWTGIDIVKGGKRYHTVWSTVGDRLSPLAWVSIHERLGVKH